MATESTPLSSARSLTDPTLDHGAADVLPEKVRSDEVIPHDQARLIDRVFFGIGTITALVLAVQLFFASFDFSKWTVFSLIGFWLVTSYFVLPRLHRVLTNIYVPNYYIGRTRTSDGLLGDPINLAFRGSPDALATAFARAGWTRADEISLRSSLRIVTSTLRRTSYHQAPVSPLFLFDRQQDVAYQQEVAGNPAKRHHIRLWKTPEGWLMPGGVRVDWLAGATYDRAVGLSLFTLQVTHRIDADIDVERDFVVASVGEANAAAHVEVLPEYTTGYHCRNGGGDEIRTDGALPIVDVSQVPISHRFEQRTELPGIPAAIKAGALLATLMIGWIALAVHRSMGWPVHNVIAMWAIPGMLLLGAVALLALVPLLRGHNSARLILMSVAVVAEPSILVYSLSAPSGADSWDLVGSGLVALLLIILSSESARVWARLPTGMKRARR